MFEPAPDRVIAVYNESARAMQAIAAEIGDYSERLLADGTATFGQMTKAQSIPEFMGLMAAFSKRAFEENAQQMTRLANMYANAAGDQTRAMQSMMLPMKA